jgi:hypothetical protein
VPDPSVAIPNVHLYETVDRDDFQALLDPARYGRRSSAFDEVIAAIESHYWDPGQSARLLRMRGRQGHEADTAWTESAARQSGKGGLPAAARPSGAARLPGDLDASAIG